jgi:hypothetical protein
VQKKERGKMETSIIFILYNKRETWAIMFQVKEEKEQPFE